MNFKLRQLQGLLALARTGSFSRAAADSSMTQPAFSQMIRELETTLDVRLFDRTTRRVDLTDAGRTLVGLVQRPAQLATRGTRRATSATGVATEETAQGADGGVVPASQTITST